MEKPIVSVIIPVIRPEKAKRCIEAVHKNAGVPREQYEVISEEDKKRIGVAKMVKQLVDKSKGEMCLFLGDDTIPQPDFMKNALRAMAHIPDGWGMVSFNDNPNTTRSAAHWLAHKKLLPRLGGEFFHTGYTHCFVDDELLIRCQQMNRYIYAFDAKLYHDHPLVHAGKESDENYTKVHSPEIYDRDHKLFQARMNNNWQTPEQIEPKKGTNVIKVAIGVPSGDLLHADFAMSLVNLCVHSLTRGIHCAIINPKFSLVEVARNEMVQDAFKIGADYLLTLDSDMTFPAQTLARLLSHRKDVVCGDAVRRREPITSVLVDRKGNRLDYSKVYTATDPLQEVMGGSNAVCLMDMKIFKKMEAPYYLVTYDKKKRFLGEDYYFSNKLRTSGFKIYCDQYLSQHIGHIGAKTYFLKDQESATKS